jgi:hypothetical protein
MCEVCAFFICQIANGRWNASVAQTFDRVQTRDANEDCCCDRRSAAIENRTESAALAGIIFNVLMLAESGSGFVA